MMNRLCLALVMAGFIPPAVLAQTNYFLVAELSSVKAHQDSFVVPLTDPLQTAHARVLIAKGPQAGGTILFADIAAGADGINRNWLQPDARPWSWHVVRVTGFGDFGIELLDGWPGLVEQNVAGWMQNTSGHIGFWSYTVVAELPYSPQIGTIKKGQSGITIILDKLTPPFPVFIEATTNLAKPLWMVQTSFVPLNSKTNLSLLTASETAFYRVRVSTNP